MKKIIQYEIKLEKSVKIILGILAVGILLNAFSFQNLAIKDVFATNHTQLGTKYNPLFIECKSGCK